ncbi:hypothetical protein M431DRAFT_290899 [Trichoderma harzianum CBS 226.95]|uniref:Uncharacterized protein n=1 Tax=Trichoderma harzianum CBS 226.95 TaxID=983964 RepID=A0A2T4APD3_TRIHA|nr:hypothetical protein M431DRAFT_290899 [Trichoderma harzianum CBS 226.95]PTB58927.1 hypothetical protein M431DRAFT_290899 [Trichoderma harzianum CBS 226.95]
MANCNTKRPFARPRRDGTWTFPLFVLVPAPSPGLSGSSRLLRSSEVLVRPETLPATNIPFKLRPKTRLALVSTLVHSFSLLARRRILGFWEAPLFFCCFQSLFLQKPRVVVASFLWPPCPPDCFASHHHHSFSYCF